LKHAVAVELQPQLQVEQSNAAHWLLTQDPPLAQIPQDSEPPQPSLKVPQAAPADAQVLFVQHAWFRQVWLDWHPWQVAPLAPQDPLVVPG
jgi:hypothetical protein